MKENNYWISTYSLQCWNYICIILPRILSGVETPQNSLPVVWIGNYPALVYDILFKKRWLKNFWYWLLRQHGSSLFKHIVSPLASTVVVCFLALTFLQAVIFPMKDVGWKARIYLKTNISPRWWWRQIAHQENIYILNMYFILITITHSFI